MIVPYISREDVSHALASLIHSSRNLEANGLRHLLLVDLAVNAPAMPAGDNVRDYVLRDLLVSTITTTLSEQRAAFLLSAPDEHAAIDVVREEIAESVEQGAFKLNVWSLLYYRYVRADLALSVEELAEALAIHPRTISRYNDEGIELLKERLIFAEYQARQGQAQRRLYTAIPYSVPAKMVGRTELLQSAREMLIRLSPRHILVTGAPGIGKTTFVQEVLRQRIDSGSLDQIVWIEQPTSVEYIHQRIKETLLREDSKISLRDYLLLYHVAIVVDGITNITHDRPALEELLRELGAATVFLVNRVYTPLVSVGAHIALPEIDLNAAYDLVEDLLPASDPAYKREAIQSLYESLGGNPLALRLAAGLLDSEGWKAVHGELNDRLFQQLFLSLEFFAQRAWCALALFSHGASFEILASTWGIKISALLALQRYGVLNINENSCHLLPAASEYIRQQHAHFQAIRVFVDSLIEQMKAGNGVLDVIENVLSTGFPEIEPVKKREWIHLVWKEGLRRNHWALWRAILEPYLSQSPSSDLMLQTAYSICLRRLGESGESEKVFQKTVAEAGRMGQFDDQARALVEWSVLLKQRGEFARAYSYLQQAKRYADRVNDPELLATLTVHEAEILIEQGRGGEGFELLLRLPQTAAVLALESEAQFILGNYEHCRRLATQGWELTENNLATEASLYTIIGRSYGEENNQDQMQRYLTNAVMLFERLDDLFSLARAETNLAASLILARQFADADLLLARSEHIQTYLNDALGLSTTLHNRRILEGYIPR